MVPLTHPTVDKPPEKNRFSWHCGGLTIIYTPVILTVALDNGRLKFDDSPIRKWMKMVISP
jgi:hypothetical protein